MLGLSVLCAVLAVSCASHYAPHSYYHNRVGEAHVNFVNGIRQAHVNHLAENVGAGTGTAEKYGVPGTFVHDGHHAYGYYGHGYSFPYYGAYHHGIYADPHNAHRQQYVNRQAEAVGAGTGTSKQDGVPGTHLDKLHRLHY